MPWPLAFEILALERIRIFLDSPALDVFQFEDPLKFLGIESLGIVDGALGIRQRNDLGAEVYQLLDRILGHVARTRHRADFALEGFAAGLQHLLGKIDVAVSRRLRADQRTAPGLSL